jgi:hypothetical protein
LLLLVQFVRTQLLTYIAELQTEGLSRKFTIKLKEAGTHLESVETQEWEDIIVDRLIIFLTSSDLSSIMKVPAPLLLTKIAPTASAKPITRDWGGTRLDSWDQFL